MCVCVWLSCVDVTRESSASNSDYGHKSPSMYIYTSNWYIRSDIHTAEYMSRVWTHNVVAVVFVVSAITWFSIIQLGCRSTHYYYFSFFFLSFFYFFVPLSRLLYISLSFACVFLPRALWNVSFDGMRIIRGNFFLLFLFTTLPMINVIF